MLKDMSLIFIQCFLCVILLSGCFTKAEPAPQAGFAAADPMFYSSEIPFHKVWWDPDTDFSKFKELYIAPVNTDYLLQMGWWQQVERGSSLQKDIPGLALYTQQKLREAFENDPKRRFKVVSFPHQDALVLKFALVEVVPTKTTLKYAGLLPPLTIPMKLIGLGSKSTAAFEARLEAGTSGKVVAMFADREAEKFSLFTVKDYSWYGHAKGIISEWAKQFAEICHKQRRQVIKDSALFELKPW